MGGRSRYSVEVKILSFIHLSAVLLILLAPGGRVEDIKFISGKEFIRSLSNVVSSLKFKAPLPDDAPVKLLRRGVLVCEGGTLGCDFTLFTVDSVNSIFISISPPSSWWSLVW